MKDAKLEKVGWLGEYVNSVLFFCNFSVNIKKFKIKKIRQRF